MCIRDSAKAVRNACFLLRLADAAGHLVVNSFVMSSFSAEQTAEGDDRVHLAKISQGAGRRGNFPGSGNPDHLNVGSFGAASQQRIEGPLEQAIGDDSVPASNDDGELHAGRREVAFKSDWPAFHRIGPGPEAERQSRLGLNGEDARLPVSCLLYTSRRLQLGDRSL